MSNKASVILGDGYHIYKDYEGDVDPATHVYMSFDVIDFCELKAASDGGVGLTIAVQKTLLNDIAKSWVELKKNVPD